MSISQHMTMDSAIFGALIGATVVAIVQGGLFLIAWGRMTSDMKSQKETSDRHAADIEQLKKDQSASRAESAGLKAKIESLLDTMRDVQRMVSALFERETRGDHRG